MGKVFDGIDARLTAFIEAQQMFFVATAPLAEAGHINVSPKGLDSFRVLATDRVAYLDCTGSSAETIAHVRENGRIVLMFCAFQGPPKILRLHGSAQIIEPQDSGFDELRSGFPPGLEARSIVDIDVTRVSDSCGFGVPLYSLEGDRTQLPAWAERKGPEGIRQYQAEKNARSVDGLPSLRRVAPEEAGT